MATPAETAAMRRAIALSAFGLGATSPNPPVGCVILDSDEQIVGEGYHERKGEAHAEALALGAAGRRAAGGTAVVTLEPCNHHGRTPPCRQALIAAGVRRVVIALIDPTSRGEGGAAVLEAHGIEVETGVLADEARLVLGTWAATLGTGRPVLTWPYRLTGQGIEALSDDMADARLLRLSADAVLDGHGHVEEGVPGSHGAGILEINDIAPGADPHAVVKRLYGGGVRSLLLQGGESVARPFLAAGLVDHVLVWLAARRSSDRPREPLPWPLLPPGFTIAGVARVAAFVRIEAWRGPDETR